VGAAARAAGSFPAGRHQLGADRRVLTRVALGVAQPLDAVALHQAHGAGVEIGPHRLAAVALLGLEERLGDLVERLLPADLLERVAALAARADAAQRRGQAPRMMDPL